MPKNEVEEIQEELAKSRQRIAELEARLEAEVNSREAPAWLYTTLDSADVGIWEWDITLDKVTWSDAIYRSHGYTREDFEGTLNAVAKATLPEDRELLAAKVQQTLKTGEPYSIEYRIVTTKGETRWISGKGQAMFDESGKPYRLSGTSMDVTQRKREEAETLAVRERIIEAQRDALRKLGAPIMPLADHTLAVPLIGLLSQERAEQVTDVVLNAVREHSTKVVLLDVTGVPSLDTSAAQALVKVAAATRLLGAQVVLTGVRPRVAQTLVELGVDLQIFVIKADLQSGIEYAAKAWRDGRV